MDLRKMMQIYSEDGLSDAIQLLIFDDEGMRENDYESIVKRVESTFKDKQYLRRVSGSRQHWIDKDIGVIAEVIHEWMKSFNV